MGACLCECVFVWVCECVSVCLCEGVYLPLGILLSNKTLTKQTAVVLHNPVWNSGLPLMMSVLKEQKEKNFTCVL